MRSGTQILSVGVSCPGGLGVEALEDSTGWPVEGVPGVGGGGKVRRVARIDCGGEPFNRWRMAPRLRRASPLSHHLIEAVAQCLEARPGIDLSRVGVVGAFFLGALEYSVRFYKGLTDDGRRFASPLLFPETVVNSPLSHVVAELGIGGPVYSQTGDTSCWASALRTAQVWLANGDADHVVVAGAEEFNAHELDGLGAVRWFDGGSELRLAEGAGAVLLGRAATDGMARIVRVVDGFCYRTREGAREAARECLEAVGNVGRVADTASTWMRPVATGVTGGNALLGLSSGPRYEAFTASCAWNTILSVKAAAAGPVLVPYWGLSHQIAAAEISG